MDPEPKDWQFKPARDLGLPLAARLRSTSREPSLAGMAVNRAWSGCVRGYLAAFHGFAVIGREHLPAEPPFVLVANHGGHLDALALAAAVPRRLSHRVHSLAAGEVFFRSLPIAAFASAAVNALPVWREHTSAEDLAFLRQRLVEDRLVFILFPEGTRSRDGVMARFRPGVGALVAGSDVPVVPCFLQGSHAAWPPGRHLPRPGRVGLRIGSPLTFEAVPNERAGWLDVAAASEAAVRRLAPSAP